MGEPRFDVFLSHNRAEAPAVEQIARRLRHEGIESWLDRWATTPGVSWQREIAQGLRASAACAVFIGPAGLGDWAREELAAAQNRAVNDRRFRLFMVLLPGALTPDDPSLDFLANRTWVDLRAGLTDRDGFQDLISAITGAPRGPAGLAAAPGECPYQGLEVFEETHAELFFGRAADTTRMVEKLKDSRFLAVLGPSGCGKNSLVRAGVVPTLRQGALAATPGPSA
ncbi:MAG: TIR domain-containing protein [Egibacteraceae bacterium]